MGKGVGGGEGPWGRGGEGLELTLGGGGWLPAGDVWRESEGGHGRGGLPAGKPGASASPGPPGPLPAPHPPWGACDRPAFRMEVQAPEGLNLAGCPQPLATQGSALASHCFRFELLESRPKVLGAALRASWGLWGGGQPGKGRLQGPGVGAVGAGALGGEGRTPPPLHSTELTGGPQSSPGRSGARFPV